MIKMAAMFSAVSPKLIIPVMKMSRATQKVQASARVGGRKTASCLQWRAIHTIDARFIANVGNDGEAPEQAAVHGGWEEGSRDGHAHKAAGVVSQYGECDTDARWNGDAKANQEAI
jgi:hypothetical protein